MYWFHIDLVYLFSRVVSLQDLQVDLLHSLYLKVNELLPSLTQGILPSFYLYITVFLFKVSLTDREMFNPGRRRVCVFILYSDSY